MYEWRKMTREEKLRALELRRLRNHPMHSPPHWDLAGQHQYLITAACYEHQPIIGKDLLRMTGCEATVLETCRELAAETYAWSILPNHYHVLLETDSIAELLHGLGQFHGRSSFLWNGEDGERGRKVWYNCTERAIRSERHFWASLNYVHYNPVHHGLVKRWEDWPWSSAREFLKTVGPDKAAEIWKTYPIKDYGKKWDF